MPRKKPFSNKQKKKQLQEKRVKKRLQDLGEFSGHKLEKHVKLISCY